MHYYIDGYNLLFRLLGSKGNLQNQRDLIIQQLNDKISLTHIDATVVFDAPFQAGGYERFRFGELEILFTNQGETADEYILNELQHSSKPRQEIVVTSDKTLAMHARHFLARTESVEAFMQRLNQLYSNKQKKSTQDQHKSYNISNKEAERPKPAPKIQHVGVTEKILQSIKKSSETTLEYYEYIFETRLQECIEEEKTSLKKEPSKPSKKARKKISPFDSPPNNVEAITQMERWLKIFSERTNDENSR